MFEIFSLRNSFFSADVVPEDQFDVELIVQCIRSSESPQTHNQALLLLATAAKFFPVSIQIFPVSILIYCNCCSKTFSTVAQKSLPMNLMVFMSVMNGIERVVCLSPVCLYAFKGTLPRDGVAIFRPHQKSYPPDKSFSRR